MKIKKGKFRCFPEKLRKTKNIIDKMLKEDPCERPTIDQILKGNSNSHSHLEDLLRKYVK